MDTGEYFKRYFEYLGNRPITAANIRNAAASASKEEPPSGAGAGLKKFYTPSI
jgi:hypothetical protein